MVRRIVDFITEFAVHFVLDAADSLVVLVGEELPLILRIEDIKEVDVRVAGEVRDPIGILILDEEENLEVAQDGQLNGFLYEALLPFAEADLALIVVQNTRNLFNPLFTHCTRLPSYFV